jgi:dTDP-4-dehydrorhamnose reductase
MLELWGGIECTVNRVGNVRFDQLERSGHDSRLSDLNQFAALGIKTMRYPVLWERVAPNGLDTADWSTVDLQLQRLRDLGIAPIVGLVHHGSGPDETSLLDPKFPEKLSRFAAAVAERYPWVTSFCPINEPLTTARFSGLYGHWHPHGVDDHVFAAVLLNQCRAIIQAMRAIRRINPRAKLVVTEDVAPTYSTRSLAYQGEFENHRRWSSIDLLCGRLIRGTRIREHLDWLGVDSAELDWFEDNPCCPDLVGIDYYPTSERFLDENFQIYPPSTRGGNADSDYADVDAVRVRKEGIAGHLSILKEVWQRYRIPIALTECHIACNVDQQISWFNESWRAAETAISQGIPVKGVTLWSLLGAFDWDTLCTRNRGYYEPGAFDISSGLPVPTKLAYAAAAIAQGIHLPDVTTGWWRRPDRLLYPPISAPLVNISLEREKMLVAA